MNQILSSKEAAEFLKLSIHQLYKLTNSNRIPSYSPTHGKLYFLQSDLEDWVLSAKRATIHSINKKINKYFINK